MSTSSLNYEKMLTHCVGRDMSYKVVVYIVRLTNVLSAPDSETHKITANLSGKITDTRMLINQWRYIGSTRDSLKTFLELPTEQDREIVPSRVFLGLSCFFRIFEQLAGDIGYYRRHNLIDFVERTRVSWHYKFWKTMSLFSGFISELLKLLLLRSKQRRQLISKEEYLVGAKACAMSMVRQTCDMIIYFQWIESYKPNQTFAHCCGLVSGSLGLYQVLSR
eukprot:PhM_4_TR5714/c0_g1_i1/m.16090